MLNINGHSVHCNHRPRFNLLTTAAASLLLSSLLPTYIFTPKTLLYNITANSELSRHTEGELGFFF